MDIDLEELADAPYQREPSRATSEVAEPRQRSVSLTVDQKSDIVKQDNHDSKSQTEDKQEIDKREDHRERRRDRHDRRSHSRSERHRSSRDHDRRSRDHDYDRRDRDRDRDSRRDDRRDRRSRSPRKEANTPRREPSPPPTEEERDKRTIFVQQLAARLRTKELLRFFEQAGPVRDAQIVKDKVSGRSKGVGYVEFKSADSLAGALKLTGTKLLGIPVICSITEAEKNRLAREEALAQGKVLGRPGDAPFHRLYVGNVHFNVGESDLIAVFEPFGDVELVSLTKDMDTGRSRGFGFVQFKEASSAREALDKMNGFDLAGRPIRVGLGTEDSIHSPAPKSPPRRRSISPSRRRRPRELDDSEQGGLSFQHISRSDLMRKLTRREDQLPKLPSPPPRERPITSRCVKLTNMFTAKEETEPNWQKELSIDVKQECIDKYGSVEHISVDNTEDGVIWVKFSQTQGGKAAVSGLNGRWFGGRVIGAACVNEAIYNTTFRL